MDMHFWGVALLRAKTDLIFNKIKQNLGVGIKSLWGECNGYVPNNYQQTALRFTAELLIVWDYPGFIQIHSIITEF